MAPLPPPFPQMLPPFKPAVPHTHLRPIAGLTQLDTLALSVQASVRARACAWARVRAQRAGS